MRIQHNIAALNSYRQLGNNNNSVSKNLEKLSSGFRINRAGDDAAGLAISEKMRAQITGLNTAQKNAQDGISLVQTAEGALTEVHSMLNRMVELANQSSNGIYDNAVDRANMQKEITSLKDEIDRIATGTNFNGIKLLDGSLSKQDVASASKQMMTIGGTAFASGAFVKAAGASTSYEAKATAAATNLSSNDTNFDAYSITFTDKDGKNHTLNLVEGAKDAITAGDPSKLAEALNGNGKLQLAMAGADQDAALKAFHDTFTVTSTTDDITFTVKDPAGKGALTSVSHGSNATDPSQALAATAPVASKSSTGAKSAGYEVRLINLNVANNTFTIGGKTYEIVANAGDATTTAGATAVLQGAGNNTSNLINALKADGFSVEAGTSADTLRFTNLSQLDEKQSGAQISTGASNLVIANQDAAKQSSSLTVGVGGATANKLTVNYVDADGKSQSKVLSYTGATDAGANRTAMLDALKGDSDLSALFDFAASGAGNAITITAKGTDPASGQLLGINTSDAVNTAISGLTVTPGHVDGKTLALKDDTANLKDGDTITVNGKTYEFSADASKPVSQGNVRIDLGIDGKASLENLSKALTTDGIKHNFDAAAGKLTFADTDNTPKDGGLTLQIGDTAEDFNQLKISVSDMSTKSLGIDGISVATQAGASAAVDKIKAAINTVSSTRGTLGAVQNRLEHTINSLSVSAENMTAAESRIRDVDMASEMMDYTKNNILVQASQAMLAQANQIPQGVLQLLQ